MIHWAGGDTIVYGGGAGQGYEPNRTGTPATRQRVREVCTHIMENYKAVGSSCRGPEKNTDLVFDSCIF